jgi:hypothetical protein
VRPLLALLTVTLLGLGAIACGGASKGTSAGSNVSSNASVAGEGAATQRYLNDGDNDPHNDNDYDDLYGKKADEDSDEPEDRMNPENGNYHDKDDGDIVNYGHAADTSEEQAVTTLVKRYYAAALAGDGAKACGMIAPAFAKAIPEDYGQAPGPSYLRGAKTCPAVMALVLKHARGRLTSSFEVTGVRVNGNRAIALLGFTAMRASSIDLARESGAWKIDALLGSPLT